MASNVSSAPRLNLTEMIAVTPTITANSAYASGAQVGGIMSVPYAVREDASLLRGNSELVEVTILDSDKQDAAFDIWLFSASPTVSSVDHGNFAITAANMKAAAIGYVPVGSTYSDAAAVSLSSTVNLNKVVQIPSTVSANNNTLYAIAVVRGTPTYTTTTSLQFQFSFYLD